MNKTKFTETQIVKGIKESESGHPPTGLSILLRIQEQLPFSLRFSSVVGV